MAWHAGAKLVYWSVNASSLCLCSYKVSTNDSPAATIFLLVVFSKWIVTQHTSIDPDPHLNFLGTIWVAILVQLGSFSKSKMVSGKRIQRKWNFSEKMCTALLAQDKDRKDKGLDTIDNERNRQCPWIHKWTDRHPCTTCAQPSHSSDVGGKTSEDLNLIVTDNPTSKRSDKFSWKMQFSCSAAVVLLCFVRPGELLKLLQRRQNYGQLHFKSIFYDFGFEMKSDTNRRFHKWIHFKNIHHCNGREG